MLKWILPPAPPKRPRPTNQDELGTLIYGEERWKRHKAERARQLQKLKETQRKDLQWPGRN